MWGLLTTLNSWLSQNNYTTFTVPTRPPLACLTRTASYHRPSIVFTILCFFNNASIRRLFVVIILKSSCSGHTGTEWYLGQAGHAAEVAVAGRCLSPSRACHSSCSTENWTMCMFFKFLCILRLLTVVTVRISCFNHLQITGIILRVHSAFATCDTVIPSYSSYHLCSVHHRIKIMWPPHAPASWRLLYRCGFPLTFLDCVHRPEGALEAFNRVPTWAAAISDSRYTIQYPMAPATRIVAPLWA